MPFQNLFAILVALSGPFLSLAQASTDTRPPNIIFILADDLGYADVGFNGQEHIRTPHLDQMATEGIVLTQHYAGSTVCMPSRCTLMTGKHTGHCTVRGNPRWTLSGTPVDLKPQDTTVAEELKRAGYRTAIIGKWGLAEGDDRAMPLQQGFDSFYGYRDHGAAHHYYPESLWRDTQEFAIAGNNTALKQGEYSHDSLADEAIDYIRKSSESPFFLYLAFTIPHLELTVPEESKVPYQDLGWPKRKMNGAGHYKNDPEGNTTYAGMVSRMDRDIGRIRAALDSLDISENTIIVFSSDNGPEYEKQDRFFNSNGPLRGGKRDLYEGGIRVPFVAVWPGTIAPGTRSEHISAFWDFLPTACDIAGVTPSDAEIDGISYLPTLLGQHGTQKQHEYLYWEFNEKAGPVQSIRYGNWKAVRFNCDNASLELYDLSTDVGEANNVADSHPEVVQRICNMFELARNEHPEFQLSKLSRKKRKQ